MTFKTVADFKDNLIRKGLVGVVLIADYSTAALTAITEATGTDPDVTIGLADLTGYETLGRITGDGITFSDSVTQQNISGWGSAYPLRIDAESEELSLSWQSLETRKATLDAFYNVDLSDVTPDSSTGEVTVDKPAVPAIRDKRVLALWRDINKATGNDIYQAILFPRANTLQNGDQTIANSDSGLVYPLKSTALIDSTEDTGCRLFWGGTGFKELSSDMGFSS